MKCKKKLMKIVSVIELPLQISTLIFTSSFFIYISGVNKDFLLRWLVGRSDKGNSFSGDSRSPKKTRLKKILVS